MDRKPLRVLVVMPSWVGDVVMATPALALLRSHLRGSFIGALLRPGLDEVLAGSDFFDELHIDRAIGVMGPKRVASKIRARRYDAALLLTNSFSTALITRLAFIPRRVGYDRDGRGLLLTQRLKPRLKSDPSLLGSVGIGRSGYALESAVDAYLRAAKAFLHLDEAASLDTPPRMSLSITPQQDQQALDILDRAGIPHSPQTHHDFIVLNPGANNPAKRWPADRFAQLALLLAAERRSHILITGSPGERSVVESIVALARTQASAIGLNTDAIVNLLDLGVTLGSLKGILRRASLLITNDTGPRHIAAAFNTPTVALFGPTDPRWTTLPTNQHLFKNILADPTLPPDLIADEHPERCSIDRIDIDAVLHACRELLESRLPGPN